MNPRRFQHIRSILARRQPDLTVLLENVHKAHNFSAVVRTADAVGLWRVHAVVPEGSLPVHHLAAGGSRRWVSIVVHKDLTSGLTALDDEFQILAANPSADAVDFREVDFTRPSAVLFGQEKDGLTDAALEAADIQMRVPMLGMVSSLNVSVAAALILFEAQRQRSRAGLYDSFRLAPEEYEKILFEGCYPRIAGRCRDLGKPYPKLDDEGELPEDIGAYFRSR